MPEAADILQRQLDDANRKITDLERDNQKQRDEIRDLKTDNKTLETANAELSTKLPKDDAVILSRADGERWAQYQELGKVDELQTLKGERDSAVGELERTKSDGALSALGLKPAAFRRLLGANETFSVTGEGEEKRITITSGEATLELDEYAEREGITDLLNAVRETREQPAEQPKGSAPTGAGTRERTQPKPTVEAALEAKRKSNLYKG